jgi:hypothetical protein
MCDHVDGWGFMVFWYREGDTIFVEVGPYPRTQLIAKNR